MKVINFLVFFLSLCFFGAVTETLSTNQVKQTSRVLIASGDVSLPPNSVNIANLFTISYTFQPVGFITMAIKFKIPNQFFAIGFGTGMVGADIWVFQLINSEIVVSDRVGLGHTSPKLDTSQGGQSDLERLGYEITSSYSLVKVRRALNTNDPNDAVISEGLVNMIYATGTTPTLSAHGKAGRGAVVIPLIPGSEEFNVQDNTIQDQILIENLHSLGNLVAWGVIADMGIIFVRLMRGRKLVFGNMVIPAQGIHALVMWIVIIMSAAVTGLQLKQSRKELGLQLSGLSDRDVHFLNGLITLSLVIFVVFSGAISLVKLKPYTADRFSTSKTKIVHRVAGGLMYLLAKANIIVGAIFYQEGKWEIGIYCYFGFLICIHIGIKIMFWYKFHNSNQSPSDIYKAVSVSDHDKELLQAINKGMCREELIKNFPKTKWVMLGNKVYNLTNWIHPGGNFIIEACVGREVGRYFYGNYNLEGTNIKPHRHSALTVAQLNSFYIGEATNYESIFYRKKGDKTTLSRAIDKWKINKITPFSENIAEVSFRNPHFQLKNFGKSLSWLGRHFRVSFDRNDSLARLYTTALSLNKANIQLRQTIYKYFDEIMRGSKLMTCPIDKTYTSFQNSISLFIKNYRSFEGLSYAIHRTKLGTLENRFRLEGPLGRGLELTTNSSGTHCIICSGTGILPMIDFLNLFLWKTMYQLIKEKAGVKKAEHINPLNIQFDSYLNGVDIKLIGAFTSPGEILGLDIIKKLAEINKKYHTNNFEAIIKGYSDENITAVKGDFSSADFLKKYITTKEKKYYVVGPPHFNEDVPEALEELGILRTKIMLV